MNAPRGDWLPALSTLGVAVAVLVGGASLRLSTGVEGLLWGSSLLQPRSAPITTMIGEGKLQFGVYDPHGSFADADYVAIEHVFVSWLDDNRALLSRLAEYAGARNRWPLVTVEPWSDERQAPDGLLEAIVAGRYDGEIERVCVDLAALKTPLLIRWGHEMEAPTGRYPWAQPNGDEFVRAYRNFVEKCRAFGNDFYFVWSPRGERELDQYFPGIDFVDVVGLSVYSLAKFEYEHHGKVRPFAQNFMEKYDRARKYGKQVMIAEIGVDGTPGHRRSWLAAGLSTLEQFPLLRSLIYFNSVDSPGAWGKDYGVPDWTISPALMTSGSPSWSEP